MKKAKGYSTAQLRKIVGQNLHALRTAEGKTLTALAKEVQISPRILSQIEKGKYTIWLTQLYRLSMYFKIKPHEFLTRK